MDKCCNCRWQRIDNTPYNIIYLSFIGYDKEILSSWITYYRQKKLIIKNRVLNSLMFSKSIQHWVKIRIMVFINEKSNIGFLKKTQKMTFMLKLFLTSFSRLSELCQKWRFSSLFMKIYLLGSSNFCCLKYSKFLKRHCERMFH